MGRRFGRSSSSPMQEGALRPAISRLLLLLQNFVHHGLRGWELRVTFLGGSSNGWRHGWDGQIRYIITCKTAMTIRKHFRFVHVDGSDIKAVHTIVLRGRLTKDTTSGPTTTCRESRAGNRTRFSPKGTASTETVVALMTHTSSESADRRTCRRPCRQLGRW